MAPCFVALLGWVVALVAGDGAGRWRSTPRALGDQVVVLAVTVLYRGSAIPVAWARAAGQPGRAPGSPPILGLLERLAPAVPPGWTVLVLTDRGLWSPRLWDGIRALGWHPLMRVQRRRHLRPAGAAAPPGRRR